MKQQNSSEWKMFLTALLFWLSIGLFLFAINSCTQSVKADIPEKHMSNAIKQQRIINAYSNLLHRIWLDKPSYVEDVLWEYDEMLELDELLEGDWDKTWEFWSKQDSIEYHLNWNHIDKITSLDYGNGD